MDSDDAVMVLGVPAAAAAGAIGYSLVKHRELPVGLQASPTVVDWDSRTFNINLVTEPTPDGAIVALDAPSQAKPGDSVSITVEGRNDTTQHAYFRIEVKDSDTGNVLFDADSAQVAPGGTHTWGAVFTMPNKNLNAVVNFWFLSYA